MTERRDATRDDLYTVRGMAEGECVCPAEVQAIRGEMTMKQYRRLVCKACQARHVLEWLVEVSEGE